LPRPGANLKSQREQYHHCYLSRHGDLLAKLQGTHILVIIMYAFSDESIEQLSRKLPNMKEKNKPLSQRISSLHKQENPLYRNAIPESIIRRLSTRPLIHEVRMEFTLHVHHHLHDHADPLRETSPLHSRQHCACFSRQSGLHSTIWHLAFMQHPNSPGACMITTEQLDVSLSPTPPSYPEK
jgi:hypothetical protein